MRRLVQNLALLIASLSIAAALFELVLRGLDFRFDIAPESIEFGWPNPVQMDANFAPDPDLFWVPEGYDAFMEGLRRNGAHLVFLGDSCTATGSYPALVSERIRHRYPDIGLRALRVAVSGWSSYQGLRQLERDVLPARPRVVTLYFGWNDHWTGFGVEDDEIGALRVSALPGLSRLRVAQLAFKGLLVWKTRHREQKPNRVSPDDFRANLTRMAELSRASGTIPVFITAPTSHEIGREPEYLARRHLRDLSELVPLHRRYGDIVREVAGAHGGVLCDVARAFDERPRQEVRFQLLRRDGIHLRKRGDELLAELLFECFEASDEIRRAWTPLGAQPARN